MTRKKKTLWPAMLVVLAMGALVVPAAQATTSFPAKFTADIGAGEEAGVDAAQLTEDPILYAIGGQPPWTCATVEWNGTFQTLGPESEKMYVEPAYETCHQTLLGSTKLVDVTNNGCKYRLTATTTETGGGTKEFTTHMDIVCPEGKKIEVHVYNGAEGGSILCRYAFGSQSNHTEIQLTNEEKEGLDDIRAHVSLKQIVIERIAGSALVCGAAVQVGAYDGGVTFRGTNEVEELIDLTVSD